MEGTSPHPRLGLLLAALLVGGGCGRGEERAPREVRTVAVPSGEANEVGLSPGDKRTHSLPLNNPSFVPREQAQHMRDDDLVVGLLVGERPRAYPWWVVRNHHVINDTIVVPDPGDAPPRGDARPAWADHVHRPPSLDRFAPYVPVLITLCEACSGAACFVPSPDGTVDRPLVFAQCRNLGGPDDYNAIGVYTIADMQTHSRWHPFTGRAESGPLEGTELPRLPVAIETWARWSELHPDTLVVIAGEEMRTRIHAGWDVGMGRPGAHSTYTRWARENPDEVDDRVRPNALVVGLSDGEGSLAYAYKALVEADGLVQLEFRGEPYLLVQSATFGVSVFRRTLGEEVLDFELRSSEPLRFADSGGSLWDAQGTAVEGPRKGSSLAVVRGAYLAEWTDWIMAHPGSEVAPSAD